MADMHRAMAVNTRGVEGGEREKVFWLGTVV